MSTVPRITLGVGLWACIALSFWGCRQSRAESPTARVDRMFAPWNAKDSPGCAVGISHNGAIVYEHGYGMANLELGVPITPDTVFALASVSKSFTAMGVMLAAEQGKLSIDDACRSTFPSGPIATIALRSASC